ncbi:MAG: hypothetical protein RMK45_06040, partial [Armatimonadota bacterium]|nr:hypothetical protein [Armatimonadota bacterium]
KRTVAWASRPSPKWLGQSCPTVASACALTRHGYDCPYYGCTGFQPVPRGSVDETPTLHGRTS